jgi:hypothetical protein
LTEPAVRLLYIFVTTPRPSPTMLLHLQLQATADTHHAALSPLPRLLVLRTPGPLS